jgi:hypothetical protein
MSFITDMIGLALFVLGLIGCWLVYSAFFEMRRLLRCIDANTKKQTELLQTQTRLLAAIANAADPVES